MLSCNRFTPINLIIIEIYFIFISIKVVVSEEFIDIKKLSLLDSYFVILDTGLYLYDLNTSDCALIHAFNNIEFRESDNKINLTELYDGDKAYIFCVINKYLFIFNEYTYKIYNYKINEIFNF